MRKLPNRRLSQGGIHCLRLDSKKDDSSWGEHFRHEPLAHFQERMFWRPCFAPSLDCVSSRRETPMISQATSRQIHPWGRTWSMVAALRVARGHHVATSAEAIPSGKATESVLSA